MIRISISFPKDLYEDLKKIADESERSLNRQVVWMLTNMVTRRKKLNVVVFSEEREKGDTVSGIGFQMSVEKKEEQDD